MKLAHVLLQLKVTTAIVENLDQQEKFRDKGFIGGIVGGAGTR